jgi:hypothetical protein
MRISIFFLSLLFPCFLFSQPIMFRNYKMNNGKRIDTNQTAFKKVLNLQFASLINSEGKNGFGSYAGVDIAASEVSFAGSHLFKKDGTVLTVKGAGGISDGFANIFDHSSLNTGISLDINAHFLRLHKLMLEYDSDSADEYNLKVDKLEYDFNVGNLAIECMADSLALETKKVKVNKLIRTLSDSISKENDPLSRASLIYERTVAEKLADSVTHAITDLPLVSTKRRNLRNKILDKLEAMSAETAVRGFSMKWFSLGYKVNHNKFKTFVPSLPLDEQIMDTSFVTHTVRVQYSGYYVRSAAFKTHFWDVGGTFEYSDNFSLLKKKELSETKQYGAVDGQRQSIKKYDVYEGAYEKDLKGVTLYGDFYYFLFKDNIAAIHLNSEWIAKSKLKPLTNLYVGFMLAVKNTKTDTPIVNFELFYKFLDLFKTTDEDYKLFERNNIGIRFAFPIKFKYNKID